MTNKIKSLRNKYKQRFQGIHPLFKLMLVGIFSVLFVVGLIALLPLPELGIPVILISLGVLSFQYKWAEQLLTYCEELFSKKIFKIIGLVASVIVTLALVLLWLL